MFANFLQTPWFWLALTVVFLIIEGLLFFTLTTIWFAISAAVMVLVSCTGIPLEIQFVLFFVLSFVLLIFTRPFAIKKWKLGKVKTNMDSLIGKRMLVTKDISEFEAGEVKISGIFWTAKIENAADAMTKGSTCEIVRVEGAHLVVKKPVSA
jgi:membrane protein implicated in regulation of membrane protease activity